jgi:cyclic pyranopterin phosphate synthase
MAADLAAAGIRRINVSLDTLDPATFRALTRRGDLGQVLDGLTAAKAAGLAVKVNAVALRGVNDHEFDRLIGWCGEQGFDLCLIESMPLGEVEHRADTALPLSRVREHLTGRWTLLPSDWRSSGPARYVTVAETGRRLGFITPLSHNFCEDCNRVRVTCTGILYPCLGHDESADLRAPLRASAGDGPLHAAIADALVRKPQGHDFQIDRDGREPAVKRHMSVTGG